MVYMQHSWIWKCAVNCLLIYLVEGQTFSLSGSASYGIRGDDYSFTCEISGGNLPGGVEFNKGGSSAICSLLLVGGVCEPSSTDTRYTCGCINGDRGSFYFNITNVQSTDAGDWICKDNEQSGVSSQPVTLLVYYPPTITSLTSDATNNMIDEDSIVTSTCSVDSLPPSVISWSRSQQGEQLYLGSQYTISKASCQHTDNYTCTAGNNIGQPVSKTIPLYVRCSPRENTETKRNITHRINTTINLEVDIIAYPPPTFTWYHTLTRQIINTARIQQLSTINYKSTLEITLNYTLFGDYIVSVYNDIGVLNFTITVIDGDPPKPPGQLGSNNIPTIVGSVIGVLVVIGIVIVIGVVIYRRKAKTDKSQDTVPMSANVKTGHDNKMVIDDNLLYEGSDHIFGPQNGTQCGKSPEAIYTEVVKKKTGQDNKTVTGERGNHENADVKDKPIPTKKPAINKEGLNYADVVFTNKTPAKDVKPVYHDAVEYAGIQPGVRGPTPPQVSDSSDDDDSPPPVPASKPKTKPMKTKKK